VDARSDIWSLGTVLFELLAGSTPFEGEDMARLCTSILTKPAKKLRMVRATAPEGLELIIAKCLEKRPDLRYRNVAELAQALLPYGPLETSASRVERIRELVSRAGNSIRPPTPATAMTVQSLLTLDPPVLPVRAGTMDSIVLPKERHPARALWVGGLALGIVIATIATVTLRSGHATAAAHSAVVEARQDVSPTTSVPPPEVIPTVAASASSAPARAHPTSTAGAARVITIAKKPIPTPYDQPAPSSPNPRARFGDRQ
jgi:serine/threonine protein kinase